MSTRSSAASRTEWYRIRPSHWYRIRPSFLLRAFCLRIRGRRGHPIAIVATAAKMAKLFWHLLTREQNYAYTLPTALAKKIRTIELKAGHPRRHGGGGQRVEINREQRRTIERQIAEHAQAAYERTIADWQQTATTKTTPMRA